MYNLYTYEKNKLMNDKIKNQEENEKKKLNSKEIWNYKNYLPIMIKE